MLSIETVRVMFIVSLMYAANGKRILQNNAAIQKTSRLAIVVLQADNKSSVTGTIELYQLPSKKGVLIKGVVRGLKPNSEHGMHIHEFGDLTNKCASLGDHYNPTGKSHGGPNDNIKHVSDLGNITANSRGISTISIRINSFSLFDKFAVVGRSIVIHENRDDLGRGTAQTSKTNGNSGARIGCGVIGIANPTVTPVPKEA